MKPVDREGNGLRNEAGTSKHGTEQKPPIMEPLFSDDPQNNDRPDECGDVVETEMKQFLLWGDIFPQKCPDPFIVMPWRIHGAEDLFVAIDQQVIVHLGDEVDGEIRVVSGGLFQQPLLLFEPVAELRARKGIEEADHGRDDPACLDEPDLGVENRKGVVVETDNESSLHLEA